MFKSKRWIVLAALILLLAAAAVFPYVAPEMATRLAIDAGRYRAGRVRKEIDLPDGLHYVYLDGGQGEPLMLLHGFGANKDNYIRVAPYLTPHYRVIIPDHIGFGESSRPPEADYSPLAQVERLRSLARALNLKHIHLAGSSMSGQIAMIYAARYPSEIKSLWLLDPAGVWSAPKSEIFETIERTGHNVLLARNEDEFAQTVAATMSDPPFMPRPMLDVMAQERIKNYKLEERIFRENAGRYSVENMVAGLDTPTLVVFGAQDRAISVATAEVLHKLLPHSQVVIMPGVGHLPMLEQPRQSAKDYLQFRASR